MNAITLKCLNQYIEYLIGVNHNFSRGILLEEIEVKKEFSNPAGKAFVYSFSPSSVWNFLMSNESTRVVLSLRKIGSIEELDFYVSNYLMHFKSQ